MSINHVDNSIETVNEATKIISDHSIEIIDAVKESKHTLVNWQKRLAITIENVKALSETMNSLVQNLGKITGIMNLIEDIASKTNLVSLNASIEATHAGVHGKSFNVVAHEIRDLANSVSKSATDISDYISIINIDIEGAGKSLNTIEDLVSENCKSSNEIQGSLKEIESISHSNKQADQSLVSSVDNLNEAFKSIDNIVSELSESSAKLQNMVDSYTF